MPQNTEHQLIESIYGVTIDLDRYSDLLRLWEDEFLRADQQSQDVTPIVESHVQNASTILEMTQSVTEATPNLQQVVAAKPLPTFLLSPDRQVFFANRSALKYFKIKSAERLKPDMFSTADTFKINKYLQQLNGIKLDEILTIIQPFDEAGEATLLFALAKIRDGNTGIDYLQISAVHVAWSANVGQVIQKSFGLSDTELDLARRYVSGERLADIALSKDRAVNTLKVQTKSLYRKTKLNSLSELVRLFSALQSFAIQEFDEPDIKPRQKIANNQNKVIKRPDGRKLYYEIYGDPKGEPVLFMHDILMGTRMPTNVQGYLFAHKIKLIAPHRAGYGHSEAYLDGERFENFTEDMQQILKAEKVDRFKILSLYVGSIYGYHLAAAMPERVIKMRMINAHVPISAKAQLAEIPMPNKVLVYTSKYMPQLLPFFMSIMEVQVKKYGAEYAMKHYYKDCEFDLELCNDVEFAEIIMDNFHCCFDGGARGPTLTAEESVYPDWIKLIKECQVEVEYYLAEDGFAPLKLTQKIVAEQANASLKILSGGQMILYKHPEQVLVNF